MYYKHDDFDFDIVNFPFLDGVFLALHLTGFVYYKLLGLLVCLVMSLTLTLPIKFLQRNFSNSVIGITNSVERFQTSIDVTMTWYQTLIWESNLFLNKAYRNLNFMAT